MFKKTRLFFTLILTLLSSCQVRNFSNEAGPALPGYQKTSQPVTCEFEGKPDTTTLTRHADDYQFVFEPYCPKKGTETQQENVTKPLNIFFVIDMTQSMAPSLKVIVGQIKALSEELTANHWTVKFAGIGFADYFRNSRVTDFMSADDFAREIQTWTVLPVGPTQVAGQLGISVALDSFASYRHRVPEMDNARNVIFYISDDHAGVIYRVGLMRGGSTP